MNLKRQHAYVLALTGYFGLFAVLMAWITWLSPPERFPIALILLIVVGPLLLPMRGLLHGRVYTFQWSTFLALFYCMLASSEVWVNAEDRLLVVDDVFDTGHTIAAVIDHLRRHGQGQQTKKANK